MGNQNSEVDTGMMRNYNYNETTTNASAVSSVPCSAVSYAPSGRGSYDGYFPSLLPASHLDGRSTFNRNTNVTGYYNQTSSDCYAYAACSAYLNTIHRIYKPIYPSPSFGECMQVADYNHGNGGSVGIALQMLENRFGFGVRYSVLKYLERPSIRDILIISVVITFSTSEQGWRDVAKGSLIRKPWGRATKEWHVALIETYNLDKDWCVCKNSWGDRTAKPRFNLRTSALHDFYITRVYYTLNSIAGKTKREFCPQYFETRTVRLKGQRIKQVCMDRTTAMYCSEFICEPDKSGDDDEWVGYDVDEFIYIKNGNLKSS